MPGSSSPSRRRRARLRVVNPRSAGVGIGSRFHVVAVPAELADDPVRKFSSFTNDLYYQQEQEPHHSRRTDKPILARFGVCSV
jgi:hypothetical protein